MEPADNVKFGDGLAVSGGGGFKGLFERHGVGAGCVFLAAEGTKAAGGDADVGRINVAVDVEIGLVAVKTLAHVIGQPAHGENVAGAVEGEGIGGVEALAGQDLFVDGVEARVFGLERVHGHAGKMIAGAVAEVSGIVPRGAQLIMRREWT